MTKPFYRPKVYTASKIYRAPLWRDLRRVWSPYIEFTSRWIDTEGIDDVERTATPEDFTKFWIMDIQDVQRSDFVLLLRDGDDVLRGALVEAGVALGMSKIVVTVGIDSDTWVHHPLVFPKPSLSSAFRFITHKNPLEPLDHAPLDAK